MKIGGNLDPKLTQKGRVDSSTDPTATGAVRREGDASARAQATKSPSGIGAVRVEVSDGARDFAELTKAANRNAEIRPDKVAAARARLASRAAVPDAVLAARILAEELSLIR